MVKSSFEGYRWTDDDNGDTENTQAMQQWLSRSLTWSEASNGNTKIQINLPPEMAQAFLNSVEQSLNQTDIASNNASQRRADAAVLMAEKSLQSEGREIATADRYQVVVSVNAEELEQANVSTNTPAHESHKPQKRATIQNAGPIATETARRIACDCSISVNHKMNGEPANIGRKSRIWPTAMARTIKDRDQVCVWPGCIQSRHLHIHHIKHWADGGETSVNNGACLCSHHHTLVHEGGYSIENVELGDWESFDSVRKLMPAVYRFRVFDGNRGEITEDAPNSSNSSNDSTYVECREPVGEWKCLIC